MKGEGQYREGIGIILRNKEGLIFVGERIDSPGEWQMPQGGIDKNETPLIAAFREIKEEVGTASAVIVDKYPDWLYYDLPKELVRDFWNGQYIGQKQKWFLMDFTGNDNDIDINAHSDPEFSRWKWSTIDEVLNSIIDFKKEVYIKLFLYFANRGT